MWHLIGFGKGRCSRIRPAQVASIHREMTSRLNHLHMKTFQSLHESLLDQPYYYMNENVRRISL